MFHYTPIGVCPKNIVFTIENDLVKNVSFHGGCNGNLQGISRLIEGMSVEEAISKLRGISCGGRPTSCPDQLAIALEQATKQQAG